MSTTQRAWAVLLTDGCCIVRIAMSQKQLLLLTYCYKDIFLIPQLECHLYLTI